MDLCMLQLTFLRNLGWFLASSSSRSSSGGKYIHVPSHDTSMGLLYLPTFSILTYHQNQPFMLVNIPFYHGSTLLWLVNVTPPPQRTFPRNSRPYEGLRLTSHSILFPPQGGFQEVFSTLLKKVPRSKITQEFQEKVPKMELVVFFGESLFW